ncbi:hypothetical protein HPB52_009031 [Rhipicephalus sanguineus]|uniref:RdRp catalytic domain-containing protein n=1 Tax=Rhipicephalus sanguineus TaxID=34632 RepID=A0A9D4Q9F7_RHISA|nr:hypothetical protein HPB52_009031 [Rhipicephalus sanguineus]
MWQEFVERLVTDASVTFKDSVQCDDEACTPDELTTDDIVSAVRGDNSDEGANGKDDAETALVNQPEESRCNADIVECMRNMHTYLGRCGKATKAVHKSVDNFEAFVLQQADSIHLDSYGGPFSPGDLFFWKGQEGGLEGLRQKGWT